MKFWKYHGNGNDFVLVDGINESVRIDAEKVARGCRRKFSIGADGFIFMLPGMDGADASMRILNADGSEAEMCGNGIRCMAKHVFDHGIVKSTEFTIKTQAGNKRVSVEKGEDGKVANVSVDMGAPSLEVGSIPMAYDKASRFVNQPIKFGSFEIKGTAVSMGNPHFVTFSNLDNDAVKALGPLIGSDPRFPKKVNVGFASVAGGAISLRVYERGSGWTLACGTGACAAAVAACLNGLVPYGSPVTVRLPGGDLAITVAKDLGSVTMKGPAVMVFEGMGRI